MMKREEIVAAVRTLIGTKWLHQGRTLLGIDCGGLLVLTLDQFGLTGYDMKGYPRRPDGTFVQHFRSVFQIKNMRDLADGDIIVFSAGSYPCHCGIATTFRGQRAIVHAHLLRRKVVEEDLESAVVSVGRALHCFAFPKVED
jgi:hypothetical protein